MPTPSIVKGNPTQTRMTPVTRLASIGSVRAIHRPHAKTDTQNRGSRDSGLSSPGQRDVTAVMLAWSLTMNSPAKAPTLLPGPIDSLGLRSLIEWVGTARKTSTRSGVRPIRVILKTVEEAVGDGPPSMLSGPSRT